MLKKILLAVAVTFGLAASAQTVKIGLVDINSVIGAMPETTAAQQKIQETQTKYEAEYTKLGEELQKQYTELQNMPETELPAIRERKTKAFADNQQKLQAFEQQVMQDLQKLQNDLMAPIIQKCQGAIESVGKEGSYTLVQALDPQTVFYYSSPAEDITPLVKTKLGLK